MTGRQVGRVNQQSKGETPLVSGLLQRAAVRSVADQEVQGSQEVESGTFRESRFQHDFSQLPIHSGSLPIQAKLKIGAVGDRYEQEADRVAKDVVEQIHAPAIAQSNLGQSVQRQEEKKEEIQAKPEITALQRQEEKPEELQAKSILQLGEASGDLESAIASARGSGQALDPVLQAQIGQAMGADFSGVRVHTDTQSDQLNRSIQARAFTTGQDVFFRQGAYEPGSRGGQELIAHELTHVVQQNGGAVRRIQRSLFTVPSISQSPPIVQRVISDQNATTFVANHPPTRQYNDVHQYLQTEYPTYDFATDMPNFDYSVADYDTLWRAVQAAAPQPVAPPPVVQDTRRAVYVAPTGGRGLTRVPASVQDGVNAIIAAFPFDSHPGGNAGTVVYINGDRTVRRRAGGAVNVQIAPTDDLVRLRIDLQGANQEDNGLGRQVRVIRFALQHGETTYATVNIQANEDFGAAYIRNALRQSMTNQQNAHLYNP
jgi:hypothetical protein